MVRNLLLTLFALCLALPSAMPAGAAVHSAHSMASSHHRQRQQHQSPDGSHHDAGKHQCIGCATPVSDGPEPAAMPQLRGPLTRPGLAARLPETRAGPDTPPPRS